MMVIPFAGGLNRDEEKVLGSQARLLRQNLILEPERVTPCPELQQLAQPTAAQAAPDPHAPCHGTLGLLLLPTT